MGCRQRTGAHSGASWPWTRSVTDSRGCSDTGNDSLARRWLCWQNLNPLNPFTLHPEPSTLNQGVNIIPIFKRPDSLDGSMVGDQVMPANSSKGDQPHGLIFPAPPRETHSRASPANRDERHSTMMPAIEARVSDDMA